MPANSPGITLDTKAAAYAKQLRNATDHPSRKTTIKYLENHAIDGTIAGKYGLGLVADPSPDDKRFEGMLAIPYITRAGVVAIKYRCVQDHDHRQLGHGKYGQHHGQQPRLYNANAFFAATDTIGMSEGEIDAIAATEHVGVPTLGMPGADQWAGMSRVWKIALKDYDIVVYFADGDTDGIRAGRTVTADLGAKGRLVRCPSDEDVASTCYKGDAAKLRKAAGLNEAD